MTVDMLGGEGIGRGIDADVDFLESTDDTHAPKGNDKVPDKAPANTDKNDPENPDNPNSVQDDKIIDPENIEDPLDRIIDPDEKDDKEDDPEKEKKVDKVEDPIDDGSASKLAKSLEKKYPEIFKENPGLRAAIFRDQEYTKVFATPNDAKEAHEELQTVDEIKASLVNGDPTYLLSNLAEHSGESYQKYVMNIMPTLYKHDPQSFSRITTPIIKDLLRGIAQNAKENNNEQLYFSVGHLSNFLFKNPNVPEDTKQDPEIAKRLQELNEEKKKLADGRLTSFKNDTYGRMFDRMKNLISINVDPNDEIKEILKDKPKVKEAIVADIFNEIQTTLKSNQQFRTLFKSLWQNAANAGYTPEASEKIQTAYLARVKSLLSPIRQKVLRDYLGAQFRTQVQKQDDNGEDDNQPSKEKKQIPTSGSTGRNSARVIDPKKVDWKNVSDEAFLSGDDSKIPMKGSSKR